MMNEEFKRTRPKIAKASRLYFWLRVLVVRADARTITDVMIMKGWR